MDAHSETCDVEAFILSVNKEIRNTELINELSSLDIKHEVVSGSTPIAAKKHLEQLGETSRSRVFLSPTEMACSYGHYLMFARALDSDKEWFLFLEDDAVFLPSTLKFILQAKRNLPSGVVLLGSCGGFSHRKPIMKINDFHGVHEIIGNSVNGSHAYLVHRRYLQELHDHAIYLLRHADSFHRARKTKLFVVVPDISLQKKGVPVFVTRESEDKSEVKNHGQHKEAKVKFVGYFQKLLRNTYADIMDYVRYRHFQGRVLNQIPVLYLSKIIFKQLPATRY